MALVGWLYVVAGICLAAVGWLGWQARLRRNSIAGVRTSATMRNDEAFRVGNRAAGPATVAAGFVAVLTGVAVMSGVGGQGAASAVPLVGAALILALAVLAGVRGHQAARRSP
jgi:uncharacterized membrane protein